MGDSSKYYNFYIFNRKGKCLYYKEWNRQINTLSDDPEEEKKLVFGMLFSLKDLASKLSPTPNTEIHTVKTNVFALHHFQSLTGMVFVMNTDIDIPDLYQSLQYIYSNIYVDCVIKNPLYRFSPDDLIDCPLFNTKLEEYIKTI